MTGLPFHVCNVFEARQLRMNNAFCVRYIIFYLAWQVKGRYLRKKSLIIFLRLVNININVYSIEPCFVVYEHFRFL